MACFYNPFYALLAESLFIVLHAFVNVLLSVSERAVNKTGQLVRHGCDGFRRTEASDKPTEICTQGTLAVAQSASGHAQCMCGAIGHVASAAFDYPAASDAAVGTQSEPGGEILLGFSACHVQAYFGDDRLRSPVRRSYAREHF